MAGLAVRRPDLAELTGAKRRLGNRIRPDLGRAQIEATCWPARADQPPACAADRLVSLGLERLRPVSRLRVPLTGWSASGW
jgi:hypothetical protein